MVFSILNDLTAGTSQIVNEMYGKTIPANPGIEGMPFPGVHGFIIYPVHPS
jgi:hypothetical protein